MEVKKILVTGSNGYIGTVLVNLLHNKKFKVTGWDNMYFDKIFIGSGKKTVNKKIDVREFNPEDLKGVDVVIHLAALSNDPLGELDPKLTEEINYKATIKLAKAAKKYGVGKFIFSSSCSIYGKAKNGTVTEDSRVNPLTAYASSKILSEKALQKLSDDSFCVCIMRNATVYGFSPRLRTDLVVNDFVTRGVTEGEIKIMSDGSPWRPLIDVRDLSNIFLEFINADPEKVNNEIFNIGFNENNFQVKDVLNTISGQLPKCKITYTGEHGADARSYKVSFDKFKNAFPHVLQKWTLDKSVAHLIKEIRKHSKKNRSFVYHEFNRLYILKKLIDENKVNKKLKWVIEEKTVPIYQAGREYGNIDSHKTMIEGVVIKQLKKIPDERGTIMHMMRSTDPEFTQFGEIYFSKAYPGVIKGWHLHNKMTLNYCVIDGMVKLVLYDARKKSKTHGVLQELFIGEDNYCLVKIPVGVVNGYKTIGDKCSILANCPDIPHDPTEMERIDPNSSKIPYSWEIVMK